MVGGTVVDQQDLDWPIGLGEYGGHRTSNHYGTIEDGDDGGNQLGLDGWGQRRTHLRGRAHSIDGFGSQERKGRWRARQRINLNFNQFTDFTVAIMATKCSQSEQRNLLAACYNRIVAIWSSCSIYGSA